MNHPVSGSGEVLGWPKLPLAHSPSVLNQWLGPASPRDQAPPQLLLGVLGQSTQGGGVADHQFLAPALDQPPRLPGAENARDRV